MNNHKKLRLSKFGKIILFLIILIIVILLVSIFNRNENIYNLIKDTKKYYIKIDYPNTKNKNINKILREEIDVSKDEFISTVRHKKEKFQYDFIVTYSLSTYKDVNFLHIYTNKFTGGNHYDKDIKSYCYINSLDDNLNLKYFIKDEKSYDKLKDLIKYYLNKYVEEKDVVLNEDLDDFLVNYEIKHFSIDNNGLNIIFPIGDISSYNYGDISIFIPYKDLKNILKDRYLNNITESFEKNISKRDLGQFGDKKLIAFTFDDGPNYSTTIKLLDNLDKYNAKVTFFVLGSRVNQYNEVLKREYEEGHLVASHTYNHLNLKKLSNFDVLNEIKNTNYEINKILGVEPIFLRPPYGSINDDIKSISNMYTILWDIDTEDWKYRDKNKIANTIVKNAHDGAIVLLHDLYMTSIDGALLAMEELEKEGYAFVTVEEMAKIKNYNFDKMESVFSIN